MNTTKIVLAAACCLMAAQGHANPYPNAGSLYRDVHDDAMRRLPPQQQAEPEISAPESAPVVGGLDELQVSHFVVYGNHELAPETLTQILEPFSHRTLSASDLTLAATTLRAAYRERGLFAAEVYVPPQAIVDGVVTLHVYEGVLEQHGVFLTNNGEHVHDGTVNAILQSNLATGAVMRSDEFERTLLLIDDLPGVTGQGLLYPGSEPGEARFLVQIDDTPLVTGNVDVDNFGNYYTGKTRVGTTLYVNSPARIGDQLTLRAVTSGADYHYLFLDYSVPIGGSGLRLGGNVDYLDYELGKEFRDTGSGDATSLRLFASYPFVRARHHNLTGRLEYAHLGVEDDHDNSALRAERRIDTITAGIRGDYDDNLFGNGINYFVASVTAGSLDILGSQAYVDFDDANVGAQGGFTLANLDLSRLQYLGGDWSAFASLAGQFSSGNLDAAQKFYIGGPFSVPGYPTGEAGGDSGFRLYADIRRDFRQMPWGGDFQLSLFYATGQVRLNEDPWEGWQGGNPIIENEIHLSSWGLAASQTWEEGVVLRASIGRQIGSNDGRNPVTGDDSDGSDSDVRAWFQAIYYF
ncbi:MAG: ShlB/FhaC/HecB family hemolysin secretion/activation protein [Gammaproteobacteria bacterium]|nr:ShlB/FhaC/HecB family hemolysin secretion/activation protein [Gammaproteobacteria bacterium]